MDTFQAPKTSQNFYCEKCDYLCNKHSNYLRHLSTDKHKWIHFGYNVSKNEPKNEQLENEMITNDKFVCECGKKYKFSQGLSKHKRSCKHKKSHDEHMDTLTNVVFEMIKQNKELLIHNNELQKNFIDWNKNNGYNNCYNITNCNNKTFNLQVFLNETCKDAMNIMDFVNSMEIGLDDLEKVGELGYVNGMTNIILKNLKALDVTKRPLHCTDAKREIVYIKDKDKWEKETENKDKMKLALKYIMHKNAKMLNVFKEKYPDCIKSYSKRSDQYNKLVIEVLGGKGDNEPQHNEKIIRRITREVTIDKAIQCL